MRDREPATSTRPRVGISRCLLGDSVRYDGGHKREPSLVEATAGIVEWVPVCPEVEAGMGVPREPIHLVALHVADPREGPRIRAVEVRGSRDWTGALERWAARRLRDLALMRLSGFVLKARSPSCGLRDVPVHGGDDVGSTGAGLFAAALVAAFPDLPVEDEERLRDPTALEEFLARVLACHREAQAFHVKASR